MKKLKWNAIFEYVEQHPEINITAIAKQHNIPPSTLMVKLRKRGVDLRQRHSQYKTLRLLQDWDAILYDLDNTNIVIKDLAAKYHVTHPTFIEMLDRKGYDRQSRNHRIRSAASKLARKHTGERLHKPHRKLDDEIIRIQHRECLSGDGISLLAHRLPLSQLHRAFQ